MLQITHLETILPEIINSILLKIDKTEHTIVKNVYFLNNRQYIYDFVSAQKVLQSSHLGSI